MVHVLQELIVDPKDVEEFVRDLLKHVKRRVFGVDISSREP